MDEAVRHIDAARRRRTAGGGRRRRRGVGVGYGAGVKGHAPVGLCRGSFVSQIFSTLLSGIFFAS